MRINACNVVFTLALSRGAREEAVLSECHRRRKIKSPAFRYTSASLARFHRDRAVEEVPDIRSIAAKEARRRLRTHVLSRRSLNPDVFSRVIGRKKESTIDDRCFLSAREVTSDLSLFFFVFSSPLRCVSFSDL